MTHFFKKSSKAQNEKKFQILSYEALYNALILPLCEGAPLHTSLIIPLAKAISSLCNNCTGDTNLSHCMVHRRTSFTLMLFLLCSPLSQQED